MAVCFVVGRRRTGCVCCFTAGLLKWNPATDAAGSPVRSTTTDKYTIARNHANAPRFATGLRSLLVLSVERGQDGRFFKSGQDGHAPQTKVRKAVADPMHPAALFGGR